MVRIGGINLQLPIAGAAAENQAASGCSPTGTCGHPKQNAAIVKSLLAFSRAF
jgi:hypothetical protein